MLRVCRCVKLPLVPLQSRLWVELHLQIGLSSAEGFGSISSVCQAPASARWCEVLQSGSQPLKRGNQETFFLQSVAAGFRSPWRRLLRWLVRYARVSRALRVLELGSGCRSYS